MRTALLVSALVVFGAEAVSAQRGTARLTGTVTSALSGRPLAGVMVTVRAAGASTRSDDLGRFALDSLPAGVQRVRILSIGREPEEFSFRLSSGHTKQLVVLIDEDATDLPPIVVRRDHAPLRWGLAGFFERQRTTYGTFLTRADITQRHPVGLPQLLYGAGVQYRCNAWGCSPTRSAWGRICSLPVYVDGIAAQGEDLRTMDPEDVAALEIYTSDFFTPFEFRAGFLTPGGGPGVRGDFACGAVVVWTRSFHSELDADW